MPRLHVTKLHSIGAVASPDNPESDILFWKSEATEPPEGQPIGGGALSLDLSQLDAKDAEPIQAAFDALEAKIAGLEKAAAVVVEEPDPLPDDLPEAVVKALTDSDERVAKAEAQATAAVEAAGQVREERATEQAVARATVLAPVLGDVDQSAPVVKALAEADGEAWAFVDEKLGSLVLMKEFNDMLRVHGTEVDGGTAIDKINAIAVELRKEDADLTPTQARVEARRRNPDLKAQEREEGDS